jgi:hypothetical protein
MPARPGGGSPQAASPAAPPAAPAAATAAAKTATPTNIPLPRFVGSHRAHVPPGGALVMGGWPAPDGRRILIFASPQPQPGGEAVRIASRILALPESRLAGEGWAEFLTDDAASSAGAVYSAEEYGAMVKAVAGFNDVELLSSPLVTTRYGQPATIEVMRERVETAGGDPKLERDGIYQSFIARALEGSPEVDLAVSSALFDGQADARRANNP